MNKATNATEWADDATTMLTTYSPTAADVVAFASTHGVIAGIWVSQADLLGLVITGENGWTIRHDGARFVAA